MIIKKIPNPKLSATKAERVSGLANYIAAPDKTNENEKCTYLAGRGFLTDSLAGRIAEMTALSEESKRSKDPVSHYVMSWKEGEQPTIDQVDDAVTIFLDELGLTGCQVIYGLHNDTDNLHLHIQVNRVDPQTLKARVVNKGFDLEAAQCALTRIEHAQGWQPEKNARYVVLENGDLGREHGNVDSPKKVNSKNLDMEQRTGTKSAQRIGIEQLAPILKNAASWTEVHEQLAAVGARYEKVGSGAKVWLGDVPIKASDIDRAASLSRMEKRFGPYVPNEQQVQAPSIVAEPIIPVAPVWNDYAKARREHYADKSVATDTVRLRHESERNRLSEQHKATRDELGRGEWKGRGTALNAMRSVTAAAQAADKLTLREKHAAERDAVRKTFPPYPDAEQWLRQQGTPELADQWRYRHDAQLAGTEGDRHVKPAPTDIRAFSPVIVDDEVHYTRNGDPRRDVSFVDKGKSISIPDWRNRDTTLAALQLSAQKWGSFQVTGNDEYKTMCVRLAAEHGLKIINPDLQDRIIQERDRIAEERAAAMKLQELKDFESYHAAVDADRYRVTSIKMKPDGSKMTFILDKKEGVTKGFTPDEIATRTLEMKRLQQRGENIYYTPLSDDKHHILIDDLDRDKLAKLLADGYCPAVVIESSPDNYQAILTVQKLGSDHDKSVANRLSDRLNQEYGDPKLSGAIHPHRAPGYENRKPKHLADDGTYPTVKLVTAEKRQCDKTLELSRTIDADYVRAADMKKRQQPAPQATTAPASASAKAKIYKAHFDHIRTVMKTQPFDDLNRVDSMIALRMRVTGHTAVDIEATMRECAPTIRSPEQAAKHPDWNDYARRTAAFAHGPAGDKQASDLAKYAGQWKQVEASAQPAVTPGYQKHIDYQAQIIAWSKAEEEKRTKARDYSRGPEMGR
jgi:hypothetical protein